LLECYESIDVIFYVLSRVSKRKKKGSITTTTSATEASARGKALLTIPVRTTKQLIRKAHHFSLIKIVFSKGDRGEDACAIVVCRKG